MDIRGFFYDTKDLEVSLLKAHLVQFIWSLISMTNKSMHKISQTRWRF